jgi:hypothetical protein
MLGEVGKVRSVLEALARDFDASALHGRASLELARELGVIQSLLDGLKARVAKRVDDTCAYMALNDRNAKQTVARAFGVNPSEAQRAIDLAERLEALPATDAAVRSGQLSATAAQLIAETAVHNRAAELGLIEAARDGLVPLKDACVQARAEVEDPDARATRLQSKRAFWMWNEPDGMVGGKFYVTPEVGGQIKAVVEEYVQKTFRARRDPASREPHEAYAADALAEAFLGDAPMGVKASVHVLVDHDVITRGCALPGETCEIPGVGPVNAQWVRSLLGDAFVTAVIKNGKDITTVAHLGRHIPAEIQTALIVGGRQCDAEGCHNRGYLERDHDQDFAKGGLTAWWNLHWLCYIHHQRKTRASWPRAG